MDDINSHDEAMTGAMVKRYLERIGITRAVTADYPSLRLIQERHMLAVPFENLNIMAGKSIYLDFDALYDKIVVQHRGGYCYELNGLLHHVLRSLGYSVTLLSGQVANSAGVFGPEFDHALLLVHLHRDYLVDVGFGDSVRMPLLLTGEVVTDVSGSYRVKEDQHPGVFLLQKKQESPWTSQIRFTLSPRVMDDFQTMNLFQQRSPESHFTKNFIVSRATPTGRISISGDTLIETNGNRKKQRAIKSAEERNDLLRHYFGIELQ